MHTKEKPILQLWALAMAAVLIFSGASPALAGDQFSAYVKSAQAVVYQNAWLSAAIGKLSQYTVVTVLAYSGGVAKISYQGNIGYARTGDLEAVSAVATQAILNAKAPVYSKPSLSSPYVTVDKGTQVYVLKVSGACAMIEKDGNVGYIYAGYLTKTDSAPAATLPPQIIVPTPTPTPAPEEAVYESFQAKVTQDSLPVYISPSASAKRLGTLSKGEIVNVSAYTRSWALIERSGNAGYCAVSGLTRYVEDPYAYLTSGEYSNEKTIYLFLTKELNFNTAAACGVLANIKYESGFRPNATGDNGRSYGICQWFSARFTRLKNFCENRGYDYTTLAAQLWFLKYELETYHPKTLKYMRASIENSAQGAYDAGWYWCYHFEGPANRASVSVTRGNYAKNTVWGRYSG